MEVLMSQKSEHLIDFTQRLVRSKSVTGQEKEVVSVILSEMQHLGFDRAWVDKFGSVIGVVEGLHSGPTILLDGHCDTVDANSLDWTRDPWSGTIENGRLYGRGSADMKASLAAMIHAAGAVDRASLAGRVAVSATVAEETVEGGTLKNVIGEIQPDFVVIGEATELNLNRGGRGRAEIKITTFGKPAHSSSPQAGHCAVTDMVRVINAISNLAAPEDPFLGKGSIVLTDIISAPYPGRSVISYQCHVTYDRRLLYGESKNDVLNALNQLPGLDGVKYSVELKPNTEITFNGEKLAGEKFFPAWVFPENHPFIQKANTGLKSFGLNPRIGSYRFCTNAAYSAGTVGIPTIGFGIGREEDAHIIDESISVGDLETAFKGYLGIITVACA